jgi:hypothetical protein
VIDTWYLGIHRANWLSFPEFTDVPVFISRRVFPKQKNHRAVGRFAIDSGGFTELQKFGRWTITPTEYVAFLRRVWNETGHFDFAAPQDWMCELAVIEGGEFAGQVFVGTGLSVEEHQRRTVDNYLELRALAPELPIIPVLQGWKVGDYLRCAGMYAAAGVDLTTAPLVGLGSVCRRQDTDEAVEIIEALRDWGVENLHGFGFKIEGLRKCWFVLKTADSLAGSFDGRRAGPCQHPQWWRDRNLQPKSEANCPTFFLNYRRKHIHPPKRMPSRQLAMDLFSAVA